jgi:hypothetical protein
MSDMTHAAPASAEAHADEPLFNRAEIREFEEADTEAGVAIGRMLSVLFIYTVLVMSISAFATYAHWMGKW